MTQPWTPGPWTVHEHGSVLAMLRGVRRQVALACTDADPDESPGSILSRRDADAALIAAAPDLAEALAKLLEAFGDYAEWHGPSADPSHHRDDCPDDDCPGCALDDATTDAVDAARAALKKAGAR